MSDKDMVTVYERRDGSKPGLWSVYWYLGWDVFCSFSLAVGITSKNTMMAIVQALCLLVFLGLTVWQLNHLTWSITDYRVRISSNLEKGLMLSKAASRAWQMLIEDSNRPAEEIRLATGLRVDVIEQMRGDVQKRLRDNPEF